MGFTINKATLVGKLGGDPETRTTTGGTNITNFNMATDHGKKNASGGYDNETTWHKVILFNLSDFHLQSLRKGATVHVSGRIQNRSYEDKEGIKRYVSEIIGDTRDFIIFESKPKSNGGSSSKNTQPQNTNNNDSNDDMPF